MNLNHQLIADLLRKQELGQTLTEEERRALQAWMAGRAEPLRKIRPEELRALTTVKPTAPVRRIPRLSGWMPRQSRWIAAAAILIAGWGWWLLRQPARVQQTVKGMVKVDADRLELSDGAVFTLAELPIGPVLSRNGACVVSKADTDLLVFHGGTTGGLEWFRVSTCGREKSYRLRMADGSVVSLAGGARLRFPPAERERVWEFSGKARMEIAPNARRPMVIRLPQDRSIRVLGTRFIVEASPEAAATKVSLLSGAVRVSNGQDSMALRANQLALITAQWLVKQDIRDSSIGKGWGMIDPYFQFDRTSLAEALQKVAAWYGCSVVNLKNIPGTPVTGSLLRSASVQETMEALANMEVNQARLELQGSTIQVLPWVH